jgi:hypothetical protein
MLTGQRKETRFYGVGENFISYQSEYIAQEKNEKKYSTPAQYHIQKPIPESPYLV